MNLQQAIDTHTEALESRGVESPRLSAELIIANVVGMTRSQLLAADDRPLSNQEVGTIQNGITRRQKHEPVPYITEKVEFFSNTFSIQKGVFIPRPETESLVAAVLDTAREMEDPKIYDLCTGTGCIICSIALNLDDGEFWASDVSNNAIQCATANVRDHDLTNYVELREGSIIAPIRDALATDFDILVCNPPYIKTQDIAKLPTQIKDHEPVIALDGGRDGMTFIKSLLDGAPPILKKGAFIFIEADPDLIPVIRTEIRRRSHFTNFQIFKDLGGLDRVCRFEYQ